MIIYDSIIIGKGPAGIQAALYIKRSNLNVLVIGKDGGSLEKAEKIENFYGQEPISGKDLVNKGVEQIKQLGVQVFTDEVVGIEFLDKIALKNHLNVNVALNSASESSENYKDSKEIENLEDVEFNIKQDFIFKVKTLKSEYLAKTVLIATGTNRRAPLIKGIKEYEGRGVSYCAICDGFFYKDKEIVIIGNGNYAISEAEALLPVTDKITILTNGKDEVLIRDKDIKCNTKEIEEISGNNKVEKIVFKDNTEINVNGIFVAEGSATSIDFARKLGAELDGNKLVVDSESMQTSIPGLYAAGDCTGEVYQISKAVYEGMKAGLSITKNLRKG